MHVARILLPSTLRSLALARADRSTLTWYRSLFAISQFNPSSWSTLLPVQRRGALLIRVYVCRGLTEPTSFSLTRRTSPRTRRSKYRRRVLCQDKTPLALASKSIRLKDAFDPSLSTMLINSRKVSSLRGGDKAVQPLLISTQALLIPNLPRFPP